jgi:adenylate cyclase
MQQVLARPDPSALLEGEEKTATLMFADLRSFTTVSESLEPKAVLHLLNAHLSAMVDVVLANKGTLDKFLGDGLMALFGVPISSEGDGTRGIRCAFEMQRQQKEEKLAGGDSRIRMGIGLATGPVVAGCVGSARRMEYTVIGDAVNLAARLEGLTKVYETDIIMCGKTAACAPPELVLRRVDRVRAKGKSLPTEIHDVVGPDSDGARRVRDEYLAAYAEYERGHFADARALFLALVEKHADGPSRTMAARCALFAERPPPAPWDGVFSLDHK